MKYFMLLLLLSTSISCGDECQGEYSDAGLCIVWIGEVDWTADDVDDVYRIVLEEANDYFDEDRIGIHRVEITVADKTHVPCYRTEFLNFPEDKPLNKKCWGVTSYHYDMALNMYYEIIIPITSSLRYSQLAHELLHVYLQDVTGDSEHYHLSNVWVQMAGHESLENRIYRRVIALEE